MQKTLLLIISLMMLTHLSSAQSVTLATTTANPSKGTVYFNNSTNQLQYWNGSAWVSLTNTPGTGWALSGTNIYKTNTGNVGIGTSTPEWPLTVKYNGKGIMQENVDGTIQLGFYVGAGSAYVQTNTDHDLNFATNNSSPKITLQKGTGNVGIGTTSPTNKLQIGSVGSTGYLNNDIAIGTGQETLGIYQNNFEAAIGSSTDIILKPGNGSGRIGINTYTTPRAPLDVKSYTSSTSMPYVYFTRNYDGQPIVASDNGYSFVTIYADESILAKQFVAISDARIKNIIGISNSAKDLQTLKAIQITDYTMKDKAQYDSRIFKKVIAQQVEQVYPQAITQVTDIVPDIYALAEKVVYNETSKTLTCTLAKNYDVKVGEKLQLIHPTAGKIKAEVIGISGNTFTVKGWQHSTDKIFVYGREVNDFRSVDYEAISMLGISAIQQLAKENEELKAKNKETDRKFEQLSARLEALEAQLPRVATGK